MATRSADARTTRCNAETSELLYLTAAHGDLLTVNMRFAIGNTEAEKLVPLLLTMMGAAAIRRGPPAPSPVPNKSEGSFWKRLFGS